MAIIFRFLKKKVSKIEKFLAVDRLEGNFVICEDDNLKEYILEKNILPEGITEGSILKILDNNKIIIDKNETLRRKKEIIELENFLKNK